MAPIGTMSLDRHRLLVLKFLPARQKRLSASGVGRDWADPLEEVFGEGLGTGFEV